MTGTQKSYRKMTDHEASVAIKAIISGSRSEEEAHRRFASELGITGVALTWATDRVGGFPGRAFMFMAWGPRGTVIDHSS